jgi:hypothetical protein
MYEQAFKRFGMASRTTPTEFQNVPGLPRTAQIYRIAASPFWQFRFFVDGRYLRKSTKEADKRRALAVAKEEYRDVLLKQSQDVAVHPTKFGAVAKQFVQWQKSRVGLGLIQERTHKEDSLKLQKDVLPFSQSMDVSSITKSKIEEYLASLSQRKLSKSTLNKHILVVRKVLKFAGDEGILRALPRFPPIQSENKARPYFDRESYEKLWKTAVKYSESHHIADYKLNGKSIRKLRYTADLRI